MMDFDATCLYPYAMWDESSVYSERETGFAFKPHMNDAYVESFNNQTFNQDGIERAFLKLKCFIAQYLTFQLLPVKEEVKIIEVIRMRIGFIIETSTSVDIQEVVIPGGKVIRT